MTTKLHTPEFDREIEQAWNEACDGMPSARLRNHLPACFDRSLTVAADLTPKPESDGPMYDVGDFDEYPDGFYDDIAELLEATTNWEQDHVASVLACMPVYCRMHGFEAWTERRAGNGVCCAFAEPTIDENGVLFMDVVRVQDWHSLRCALGY